ncbi:MAG: bis(5'-nucleosyl)-tetraphosphatase (symmetrical) YqeK [Clostridia bacterium]|nr:bis(5'-nucleosyl)-tetraphosphatase (symmetrical) YqeK [Clostridia bacterium]
MKIGFFGGAFDPIHEGHLSIIRGAVDAGLDLVIVIPSARAVFKRGHAISAAPYRYYMSLKGLKSLPEKYLKKTVLSDIEFRLSGISYTYNTVCELLDGNYLKEIIENFAGKKTAKKFSEATNSYYWLCGSDILESFDNWYKPAELLSKVSLMTAIRPGYEADTEDKRRKLEEKYNTTVYSFEIDGIEIASSSIKKNRKFDNLPAKVSEFIYTHNLYNEHNVLDEVKEETAAAFYEYAIDLFFVLTEKRMLHTLNVGIYAAQLALIHGCDADKALIAGILHDCAKDLPVKMQAQYANMYAGDVFNNEKLYHSPAGAYLALNKYHINDSEILDAIKYHTTGHGGMTLLESIVYLADKLEPSRTYSDLTEMRKAATSDIKKAMKMVSEEVRDKFISQNRDVHPLTLDMMREFT